MTIKLDHICIRIYNFYYSYNYLKSIQMEVQSFQISNYKALLQRSIKTKDFTTINKHIERIFNDREMLNLSFKLEINKSVNNNFSNVDTRNLVNFYSEVNNGITGDRLIILRTLAELLKKLDGQNLIKEFVRDIQHLRIFIIIILFPRIYQLDSSVFLFKISNILNYIPNQFRQILANWIVDIQSIYFEKMVNKLQECISMEIKKLLPDPQNEKVDQKLTAQQILVFCRFIQILHKSNQIKNRIDNNKFLNRKVMDHFQAIGQYKLHVNGIKILNFIQFPFFLNLEYKQKLLEIQTLYQQKLNIEKGFINVFNGGEIHIDPQQGFNVMNVIFLHFQIHRDNILDETLQKLGKTKTGLKKPLKVRFIGEPGDDGGGVKKQFFQLIIRQIFNPNRDMFVTKNKNLYQWFNGSSFEPPIMFELLGTILGLSIYNTTLLDVKFPKVLYKKLLYPDNYKFNCLQQLKEFQPDFYYSLKNILNTTDDVQELGLSFVAEQEVFGQKVYHMLKPDGDLIFLNNQNKKQYCQLYANWILNKQIQTQFRSFKRGFYKVVTGSMIKLFTPQQLERIICGIQQINFEELKKGTKYQGGYTQNTPVIKYLWEILESFDLNTKKQFLFFVTGSDRSPIGGLSTLKLVVERHGPDSDNLPTAHTCFNVFLMPQYSSKQKLRSKLILSIRNKEGFGLI